MQQGKTTIAHRLSSEDHAEDLRDFAFRLRSVSERARKLLASIAEMAHHGRGEGRRTDVAYLPELYESTGLDVESTYVLLQELQSAKLIAVEDPYPFEDIKILPCASGWNALGVISRFTESEKVSLRDILVDLRFELLP
jgi:hypothetical protein